MGYKYNDVAIKCPIFRRVVKTSKGQFIAIECDPLDQQLGFTTSSMVRVHNSQDLKDYTELFCKGCYAECPYFKSYMCYQNDNGEGN